MKERKIEEVTLSIMCCIKIQFVLIKLSILLSITIHDNFFNLTIVIFFMSKENTNNCT